MLYLTLTAKVAKEEGIVNFKFPLRPLRSLR